jgi:hypothetical protein
LPRESAVLASSRRALLEMIKRRRTGIFFDPPLRFPLLRWRPWDAIFFLFNIKIRPLKAILVQKKTSMAAPILRMPVRGELQENANPEDRRRFILRRLL